MNLDVNGAWESAFIPTLLRYLGANTKPWRQWTPTSPGDVYILELIRNAVCGENVYAAAQDYDIYNIVILYDFLLALAKLKYYIAGDSVHGRMV